MLLKGDPWRHKAGCAVRTSQISKSLLIDWAGEAARGSLRVKSPLSATSGSNNIVRLSNATAGSPRPRNCRETPQVNAFETDYSAVARKRKLICLLAFYWGFPRVSHARVVASAKAGGFQWFCSLLIDFVQGFKPSRRSNVDVNFLIEHKA